jgi:hypothetical protein
MNTSFVSYQHLADFALTCQAATESISIRFPAWFAANMSSPLGAILSQFQARGGVVTFENPDPIF